MHVSPDTTPTAQQPPTASYGFHCGIDGRDFTSAVQRVIAALKAEG